MSQSSRNVPYLGEYLSKVLKPRVEEALGPVEQWLNQVIWDKLARVINEQQPGEIPKEELLELLKKELGLHLTVTVESEYARAASTERTNSNGSGPIRVEVADADARDVEKLEVKRRGGRPLVDAVLRKDEQ